MGSVRLSLGPVLGLSEASWGPLGASGMLLANFCLMSAYTENLHLVYKKVPAQGGRGTFTPARVFCLCIKSARAGARGGTLALEGRVRSAGYACQPPWKTP